MMPDKVEQLEDMLRKIARQLEAAGQFICSEPSSIVSWNHFKASE